LEVGAISAVLGLGGFTVVVWTVGIRLLLLARRTRQLPELLIGLAFVGCGAGYVFMVAARVPQLAEQTHVLHLVGRTGISIGCACVALTTWRLFRPSGAMALAIMYVLFLGFGAGFVADVVFADRAFRRTQPLFWFGFATNALAFAWAAFEPLRYYRMLRRQIRLGLGDPAIARRILLWGVAAAAIFLNFPVLAWSMRMAGGPFNPAQGFATTLLSCIAAYSIWAAFFPPSKRLVPRRTPAPDAPGSVPE
jgi:hypothetical protein